MVEKVEAVVVADIVGVGVVVADAVMGVVCVFVVDVVVVLTLVELAVVGSNICWRRVEVVVEGGSCGAG